MTGAIGVPGFAGEWHGGTITPTATCVLAPNPSPMTLDGTNTWIIGRPASGKVAVIDPGPDDYAHWNAVAAKVEELDAHIELIILTHAHRDHSAGARLFAEQAGCNVRALDPTHRLGGEGINGGDVLELGGTELHVIATPGHTSDSLSFVLPEDGALLTGDTVLGRGTTVVAYPDGDLSEYLDSLERLAQAVDAMNLNVLLPGHGPKLDSPGGVIEAYLKHRHERLDQVREAIRTLAIKELSHEQLAQHVVETVYADVPRAVWPAALLSVRAQLAYLLQ